MISVRNIYKTFDGTAILKGVSCEIPQGEKVVIIGPSGSGKSTLLRCMNLLETPDKGEVWLQDKLLTNVDVTLHPEFDSLDKKQLAKAVKEYQQEYQISLDVARSQMGMVFQHFNLFNNLTVLQNLTLAPVQLKLKSQQDATSHAMQLLKRIGLEDKANVYPSTLSGGQKQRIAIVRALAMQPKVLLFDEPTSALDIEMVQEVLALICDLAKENITMVIVTHELKLAQQIATQVVFMADGKIVESGEPSQIFNNPQAPRLKEFLAKVL